MRLTQTIAVFLLLLTSAIAGQEKNGAIPHTPLLKTVLPGMSDLEVAVNETEYAPGGINPRHRHPAAITFYVVSETGVWQEDGKPSTTLHAGDGLFESVRGSGSRRSTRG